MWNTTSPAAVCSPPPCASRAAVPGAVHVATEGSRVTAAQVRRCAGGTYCVCVCPRCSPPPLACCVLSCFRGCACRRGGQLRRGTAAVAGQGTWCGVSSHGRWWPMSCVCMCCCFHRFQFCCVVVAVVRQVGGSGAARGGCCGGREGTTTRYVHALLPCFPSLPCSLSPAFLWQISSPLWMCGSGRGVVSVVVFSVAFFVLNVVTY